MRILTRSRRICKALRTIQARIPVQDWQTITGFLNRIQADREWVTVGPAGLDRASAGLLPLYSRTNAITGAQIRFTLPVCRLYSNTAIVGVVAHELAHAVRAAKFGNDYGIRMLVSKAEELRAAEIPALLTQGLHFELSGETLERYDRYRKIRNDIAHGKMPAHSLKHAFEVRKNLGKLAATIDDHSRPYVRWAGPQHFATLIAKPAETRFTFEAVIVSG